MQDRKLAQESIWAHETELPEVGGLLIAQPQIIELTGDPRLWQLVVLLLEHGPRTVGLIINRPSSAKVGDLLAWGYSPSQVYTAFSIYSILFSPVRSSSTCCLPHIHLPKSCMNSH